MFRTLWVVALGAVLSCLPLTASAGLVSQDGPSPAQVSRAAAANGMLETNQYRLPERRVPGNESVRQRVTAWEVTGGSWEGVSLQGLSLVLVQNTPDSDESAATVNCYVSHLATASQRHALISAYVASQAIAPSEVRNWRIEPAVISFEISGQRIILHLGLVA